MRAIKAPELLSGCDVEQFSGFTPNPVLGDVVAGSAARLRFRPDLIVAVGGGSAIDTAKLLRLLPPEESKASRLLANEVEPTPGPAPPLVAIPTTAGSGSEVTRFATVYVNGKKMSLDGPAVTPQYALVDPGLLATCPSWLLHSCAFDTLCHAVESYWNSNATEQSRSLAMNALSRVLGTLGGGLQGIGDEQRTNLATAATLAGQAIDFTRTTAAHAFSYRLTSRFGIPHGVACLLNLLWLFDYNLEHDDSATATLKTTFELFQPDTAVSEALRSMLTKSGFSTQLRSYGVRLDHVGDLVDAGLGSNRASNNPVELRREDAVDRVSKLI